MSGSDVPPDGISWENVARAETHPTRVSILEILSIDGGRTLSQREMAFELQELPPAVGYHVKELYEAHLIRRTHEQEQGGVIEHFYCLPHHDGEGLFERLRWLR
jgi:DNA-binding MarR family transcriptional regulator